MAHHLVNEHKGFLLKFDLFDLKSNVSVQLDKIYLYAPKEFELFP